MSTNVANVAIPSARRFKVLNTALDVIHIQLPCH